MSNRIRNIYQGKALYVGVTGVPSGVMPTPEQLFRIQDISHNYDLAGARTPVYELGKLAPLSKPISAGDVPVDLSFSYYLTNGINEKLLGFALRSAARDIEVSATSGFLNRENTGRLDAEKNYYIATVPEGNDAVGYAGSEAGVLVTSIGNGFLSDYSIDVSVGDMPSASVSIQGANLCFVSGSASVPNPAIDPRTAARLAGTVDLPTASTGSNMPDVLRAGDIDLELGGDLDIGGAILSTMHPQSFSLSVPMSRSPLQEIGSNFPFSREIDLPVSMTFSVSAIVSEVSEGCLDEILTGCVAEQGRDIIIKMRSRCAGVEELRYEIKNAVLDSQSFSISTDGEETVDLQFSAELAGPQDTANGLFISGSHSAFA